MRVTDLDKFSLEEIWRPYQTLAGHDETRLMRPPLSLEDTAAKLSNDTDWSRAVLYRLARLKIEFPRYVRSPLVDVLVVKAGARSPSPKD